MPMISPSPTGHYNRPLLALAWSLYALAALAVLARLASRRLLAGPNFLCALRADDYLMVLALASLAGVAYSSNEVAANGSNYVEDGVTKNWTQEQVARAVWGSKLLVLLEECLIVTLWLVKGCLLVLYGRLTSGLRESIAVKAAAVYCIVSFVVVNVLYLGVWCRPIGNYWAVPIPPGHDQCKNYHDHLITITVLHVSSDLLMVFIPIPMIARTRLPLRQKIILCCVFSLGVLVVILAILNRTFNFLMPHQLVFLAWYNGEGSTAVITANIPFCWALARRIFGFEMWGGGQTPDQEGGNGGGVYVPPPPTIGSARDSVSRQRRGAVVYPDLDYELSDGKNDFR